MTDSQYQIRQSPGSADWELRRLAPSGGPGILVNTYEQASDAVAAWESLCVRFELIGVPARATMLDADGSPMQDLRSAAPASGD